MNFEELIGFRTITLNKRWDIDENYVTGEIISRRLMRPIKTKSNILTMQTTMEK